MSVAAAALARKLNALQERENNGRGVSAVRAVSLFLDLGDAQSARTVAQTEADKIRNYPEIERIICTELVELHTVYKCPHKKEE